MQNVAVYRRFLEQFTRYIIFDVQVNSKLQPDRLTAREQIAQKKIEKKKEKYDRRSIHRGKENNGHGSGKRNKETRRCARDRSAFQVLELHPAGKYALAHGANSINVMLTIDNEASPRH